MDKYEELDINYKNSFASNYRMAKVKFEKKKLNDYSCKELEENYNCFQILLERITELSKEYFGKIIDNDTSIYDNKIYFDLSCVYIAEIQNIYLNRINYKINEKNNSRSLRLAWIVAIVSLILSLISIYLTIRYENINNDNSYNKLIARVDR